MSNPLYDHLFGQHLGKPTVFLRLPDGSDMTHDAFLGLAAQYAHGLVACGLKPGDRLAAQVAKSPEALALYAACVQAGVVFLPLNTAYTADEVAYFVENSGAALVLADPKRSDSLTPVASACRARLETMGADGKGSFATLSEAMPRTFATVDRTEDDLAAFLYTSGTTGRSKGAMLTQGNLLSNAQALRQEWRFTADDVLLHALPIFHTHGLFVASNITLLAGGQMIFLPKFDVDVILDRLPEATTLMGVPTFYTRLLDDARFTKDATTAHMRLFVSGSAPLLAETHVQFETRTGHRILERYGMTETNMNTSNPYDGERRAGTVGFALPGIEIRITDKNGVELPQGEIGEIEVRGPNVFKGYWQMPEKTAEELRENGFFITGDLGQIDADGYLSIVGRNKDLIISGGYNIYPKEIELLLDEAEGVLESAVIGVPHPDFGETVVGVLVAQAGKTPDLEAIKTNIATSLARFKLPQKLIVLPELPRNAMGKVQKKQLRDAYKDLFA